jgi:hypothetical protein
MSVLEMRRDAVVVPALASHVRPGLILAEREARAVLDGAARRDVASGGCFAAGPAGVQVWSGPFDGACGGRGGAVRLGCVDWTYHTPVAHYATIYRVVVTAEGLAAGETMASLLAAVLALAHVLVSRASLTIAAPPARDLFRR